MEVAVKLPPFKPPKVAAVEYEAPQLLPLPDMLDEEVYISCPCHLSQLTYMQTAVQNNELHPLVCRACMCSNVCIVEQSAFSTYAETSRAESHPVCTLTQAFCPVPF